MAEASVKNSGGKIAPQSDLRVGAAKASDKNLKCFATWNVRTLLKPDKLVNLTREFKEMNLDVMGICEHRWRDPGDMWSDDVRIIHSGTIDKKPGQGGVGLVLSKEMAKRVKGYVQYSGRLILVKLETKPTDTVIIQAYMPTSGYQDEDVEIVYDELGELLKEVKRSDNLIIMGDWNAIVGEGREGAITGDFGLGLRNARGDRLIEFCAQNELIVGNTMFDHHPRRRYTWKAPGDRCRSQIDYILVRERFKNQMKDCRAYAAPDIDSDHNMVMMKCSLQFKKLQKGSQKKYDVNKLKNGEILQRYQCKTKTNRENELQQNVTEKWDSIKNCLLTAADEVISMKPVPKKKWITQVILDLIEERRRLKNDPDKQDEYRRLRNRINRETKKAREGYLLESCKDISAKLEKGEMDQAYRAIKSFFQNPSSKGSAIEDENGNVLVDLDKIAQRWKNYIEKLYKGNPINFDGILENEENVKPDDEGDTILRDEFDAALKRLGENKAAGIDNIPAEIIKAADSSIHDKLYDLVCQIYETGTLPADFTKCAVIPLPKKPGTRKCEQHRTLSLVSHASKILTNILLRRLTTVVEESITDDQFGFRSGRGTREAILSVKIIAEKRLAHALDTYLAFIDLEKAFDKVDWNILFEILKAAGVKYKDRRIIWCLYKEEKAVIRCGSHNEEAAIQQGVRQGCSLSPILFNLYIQKAMDEVRAALIDTHGVRVHGEKIDMIRFADDIALIAESKEDLEELLGTIQRILNRNYNMKINKTKTKTMVVSRRNTKVSITLENVKISNVDSFTYLGSRMTAGNKDTSDIKSRIHLAKTAFNKRSKLFTSRNISLKAKKRVLKVYVWSVLLYASETWSISEAEKKKLEAFECWCYRRMLGIKWTDRVTNDEVFRRVNENRSLINVLKTRRGKWIGHLLRHDSLPQRLLEGMVEGQRYRGRPRSSYIQQIQTDVGCATYVEMKKMAEDRKKWKQKFPTTAYQST